MRRFGRIVYTLCALMVFAGTPLAQQHEFYLKNGDRVVFYGDSITEQRLYTTFIETYVLTRWPELNITFINAGWSGDRVTGGRGGSIEVRLKRDVIAYQPTVVTVMLGMNDGDVKPYDQTLFNKFANGYRHIIETLKAAQAGVRITVIRPSPYDDVTREPRFDGGYNSVLVRYGDFIEELARQQKLDVADMNRSVVAALTKANSLDANLAQRIIPDRVHPGPGGHLLMAQALLKAWSAPAIVAAVEIDAAKAWVTKAENTKVSQLTNKAGVSWMQLDRSLPMPLDLSDPALALAVKSSDFLEKLNLQLLTVTGLPASQYALQIDGQTVGTFASELLATGINLATLPTPMAKQAQAIHLLTLKRNGVHRARWREIQVPFQDENSPAMQKAIDALSAFELELIKKQRAMAQPVVHRFQLVPSTATEVRTKSSQVNQALYVQTFSHR